MNRLIPRLHAVTDDRVLSRPDFIARAGTLARSHLVALHLRSRNATGKRLWELARSLKDICTPSKAALFVNDRVDVARAVAADGVHLPAHGVTPAAARRIVGQHVWIGCSVHDADEAAAAGDAGADFVFLGPIWETASHPGRQPLGPEIISTVERVKVIAIGGITPQRVRTCMSAGAYGVAVVSALWFQHDADAALRDMLLSLTHEPNDDGAG